MHRAFSCRTLGRILSSEFCLFYEVTVGLGVVCERILGMSCNREQFRAGEPHLALVGTGGGREVGGGGTYTGR